MSETTPTIKDKENTPKPLPEVINEGQNQGFWKMAIVAVLFLVGVVLIILLVINSFKKVANQNPDDINAIRNNFNRPANSPASSTPTSGVGFDSTSTPVTKFVMPRGSETLEQNLPPRPPLPTIFTPLTYTNPTLGFSMQINQTWQAQDNGDNQSVTFTNAQGQSISVQVYMVVGEGLGEVENQLRGSSSVTNLTRINFLGEPALQFNMYNGQGLAVIHNAKVYYIMAPNLNQEPVTTFSFN